MVSKVTTTENKQDDRLIGSLDGIEEGGKGLRFDVKKINADNKEVIPAFAVRYDYQTFAYLNRCGHIAIPLDYMPGEFFSDDGQTLICSTHGAEYAPDTGACLGGPCFGVGLERLEVEVIDGQLYLDNSDYMLVKQEQVKENV